MMRAHDQQSSRAATGSLVVEFALVLTILLLLVVVVAEASAAWRIKSVLVDAARGGARVASTTANLARDDTAVLQIVDDILEGAGLGLERSTRSVQFEAPLRTGDPVTVQVTHDFEPFVLGLVPSFENQLLLSFSSTSRYAVGSGN